VQRRSIRVSSRHQIHLSSCAFVSSRCSIRVIGSVTGEGRRQHRQHYLPPRNQVTNYKLMTTTMIQPHLLNSTVQVHKGRKMQNRLISHHQNNQSSPWIEDQHISSAHVQVVLRNLYGRIHVLEVTLRCLYHLWNNFFHLVQFTAARFGFA